MRASGLPRILFIDDNPADTRLIQEGIRRTGIPLEGIFARNANEALTSIHADRYLPDLIFLEIAIPVDAGLQVLTFLKASPEYRHIPIVVLTSVTDSEHVVAAYDALANCVVSKPADAEGLSEIARIIAQFWLRSAVLPRPLYGDRGRGRVASAR